METSEPWIPLPPDEPYPRRDDDDVDDDEDELAHSDSWDVA